MFLVLLIIILFLLYWIFEFFRILYLRGKINTRILVTGSRGKSSVTRLIAAGLNAGGITSLAKVTGSEAQIIFPDATTKSLNRQGMASIIEQKKLLVLAARNKVDTLVLESMSLRPQLMKTESQNIVDPHMMVLCKISPDHLDITADSTQGLVRAFAGAIPEGCRVVTMDQPELDILAKYAPRGTEIDIAETQTAIDMDQFTYLEHVENVQLALQVCRQLGVDENTALQAMYRVEPDPGALRVTSLVINEQPVTFVQAFAANDPQSVMTIRDKLGHLFTKPPLVILNTRSDRPYRSRQMLDLLCDNLHPRECILTGNGHISYLAGKLDKAGIHTVYLKKKSRLAAHLVKTIQAPTTLLGIGNYWGMQNNWTDKSSPEIGIPKQ